VKILFLSGALEPGKDGVGDYTRTLATECTRLGHETFLLSLNDPWIDAPLNEQREVRLGAKLSWPNRLKFAKIFVTEIRPDMVSLQFVPYSFHPAGLSFALPQLLRACIGRIQTQVMFHEIWIGEQTDASRNARVIGFCQRKIIEGMVKSLTCQAIHTSNPVYIYLLTRRGIDAKHLPLFGSVPVVQVEKFPRRNDNVLRLGMFGSIHPEWSPDELFVQLLNLHKPIQFSHIGRIGPGESVWMNLAERYGSMIDIQRLGERSLEDISRFFSSIDFGVSTTPQSLIGKSSSVAAMLDHGLPVIVNRNDVHFRGVPETALTSELLIPLDKAFLERLRLASTRRQSPKPRLPEVAEQFLREIGTGSRSSGVQELQK
jgi:glycosyltransferase involved in cell wall biosynthesis